MSNKQLNSVEQNSTENNSSLNQPGSRRGFFKKAAVGSALITTVSSAPVWGVNINSISGNLSGNTSGCYQVHTFDGNSPGYYQNKGFNANHDDQYGVYTHQNNRIPSTGWLINGTTTLKYEYKLSDILLNLGFSDNSVQLALANSSISRYERYFICAILNAHHMSDYPYSINDLLYFAKSVDDGLITQEDAADVLSFLVHNGEGAPIPTECVDYSD